MRLPDHSEEQRREIHAALMDRAKDLDKLQKKALEKELPESAAEIAERLSIIRGDAGRTGLLALWSGNPERRVAGEDGLPANLETRDLFEQDKPKKKKGAKGKDATEDGQGNPASATPLGEEVITTPPPTPLKALAAGATEGEAVEPNSPRAVQPHMPGDVTSGWNPPKGTDWADDPDPADEGGPERRTLEEAATLDAAVEKAGPVEELEPYKPEGAPEGWRMGSPEQVGRQLEKAEQEASKTATSGKRKNYCPKCETKRRTAGGRTTCRECDTPLVEIPPGVTITTPVAPFDQDAAPQDLHVPIP